MSDKKADLIRFMHCCGFENIDDIAYWDGIELVATKLLDADELWWRQIEVEGSGLCQLFRGSIKDVLGIDNE